MLRRTFVVLVAVLVLVAVGVGAQEESEDPYFVAPTHSLGDQVLQIGIGPFIPLFFQSLTGVHATGLTIGGTGALQWNAYLNATMRVGIEIGGMFAFSRRGDMLIMVPIVAKYAYVFSAYPFEFPLSMAVGMAIVKYQTDTYVDPILKPGFGAYWQYDVTWSFGLNLSYWWVPHISTQTDTRFGNFLDISLSAVYNF